MRGDAVAAVAFLRAVGPYSCADNVCREWLLHGVPEERKISWRAISWWRERDSPAFYDGFQTEKKKLIENKICVAGCKATTSVDGARRKKVKSGTSLMLDENKLEEIFLKVEVSDDFQESTCF